MLKKISYSLIALALFFSILACSSISLGNVGYKTIRGSGTVVEETRTIENVSGVELAMQGTLHIEVGPSESLRIEAEDNLLDYIQTDTRGSTLVIETTQGTNVDNTKPINFYLTVSELDEIGISSSGDVESADGLASDNFEIRVSSSGNLSLADLACTSLRVNISSSGSVAIAELTAESINVNISSSGNLVVQGGQVETQDVNISSSGEYNAEAVPSVSADVTLSSSGSATIRVSDRLTGSLSSSGDIYYIGNPSVDVNTSSSGKAVQIDQ